MLRNSQVKKREEIVFKIRIVTLSWLLLTVLFLLIFQKTTLSKNDASAPLWIHVMKKTRKTLTVWDCREMKTHEKFQLQHTTTSAWARYWVSWKMERAKQKRYGISWWRGKKNNSMKRLNCVKRWNTSSILKRERILKLLICKVFPFCEESKVAHLSHWKENLITQWRVAKAASWLNTAKPLQIVMITIIVLTVIQLTTTIRHLLLTTIMVRAKVVEDPLNEITPMLTPILQLTIVIIKIIATTTTIIGRTCSNTNNQQDYNNYSQPTGDMSPGGMSNASAMSSSSGLSAAGGGRGAFAWTDMKNTGIASHHKYETSHSRSWKLQTTVL